MGVALWRRDGDWCKSCGKGPGGCGIWRGGRNTVKVHSSPVITERERERERERVRSTQREERKTETDRKERKEREKWRDRHRERNGEIERE